MIYLMTNSTHLYNITEVVKNLTDTEQGLQSGGSYSLTARFLLLTSPFKPGTTSYEYCYTSCETLAKERNGKTGLTIGLSLVYDNGLAPVG